MIVIMFQNGKTFSARGPGLGFWRRLLLAFRIPVYFKSYTADDKLLVQPWAVQGFQVIDDQVAEERRKKADEMEKQQKDAESMSGRRGGIIQPGFRIPSNRR